jgi:multiple sugar transport system permease protein
MGPTPRWTAARVTERLRQTRFWSAIAFRAAFYLLLFDIAFVFLFPFLYMIVTSLKTPADMYNISVKWVPRGVYFGNFVLAFKMLDYATLVKNSVVVTALGTAGHVLGASIVGYGFARFRFPGKDLIFMGVLLTVIIPPQTYIVPLYREFLILGWIDSYLPLVVPTFFGFGLKGGVFVFIYRQFFAGMPYELEDSAYLDGCGFFRTYWNIFLPMSRSALVVTAILGMAWHWNDYFEPQIFIRNRFLTMLPTKLPFLYEVLRDPSEYLRDPVSLDTYTLAVALAGTFLVILPILVAYLALQRQFMESMERSGLVG